MVGYAERHYQAASAVAKDWFDDLIALEDDILQDWVLATAHDAEASAHIAGVFQRLEVIAAGTQRVGNIDCYVFAWQSASAEATQNMAARLAAAYRTHTEQPPNHASVYLGLSGDLGAGKTTFCRGFIQHLVPDTLVKSPTYELMVEYPSTPPVVHMDAYRIGHANELEYIGLFEAAAAGAICLVEWPENARLACDAYLALSSDATAHTIQCLIPKNTFFHLPFLHVWLVNLF